MIDERSNHDASWAAACCLMEEVAPLLHKDEQTKFVYQAYRIVRAAIEAYCIQQHGEQQQVEPSRN